MYSGLGAVAERVRGYVENEPDRADAFVPLDEKDAIMSVVKLCAEIHRTGFQTIDPTVFTPDRGFQWTTPEFYKNMAQQFREAMTRPRRRWIHSMVHPFAIYFPQFHVTEQNDVLFESDYTDMMGVRLAKSYDRSIRTPMKYMYPHYDIVKNKELFGQQCQLASNYGFRGFAMYYYWFSTETITHQHTIFSKFFEHAFFFSTCPNDFSVYFLWANEDWTNNLAFGTRSNEIIRIENDYSPDSIEAMCYHLLRFIAHPLYYRHPVTGRPVFGIHHPWVFPSPSCLAESIRRIQCFFERHLSTRVHILCNAMDHEFYHSFQDMQDPEEIEWYEHHPKYKTMDMTQFMVHDMSNPARPCNQLMYNKYVNYIDQLQITREGGASTMIPSIFTSFDNTPRLWCHPNKNRIATTTRNFSVGLFSDFISTQLGRLTDSKIIHINAWNEWGEQMTLEPSEEQGFDLLNIWLRIVLEFGEKRCMTPFHHSTNVVACASEEPRKPTENPAPIRV